MDPRLSGQNCKFLKFLLSFNSPKNKTRYRSLSPKPRSHVRILIYRTWPIILSLRTFSIWKIVSNTYCFWIDLNVVLSTEKIWRSALNFGISFEKTLTVYVGYPICYSLCFCVSENLLFAENAKEQSHSKVHCVSRLTEESGKYRNNWSFHFQSNSINESQFFQATNRRSK